MGDAFSTYGEKKGISSVRWGNLSENAQLKDFYKDLKIILKRVFEKQDVA
jgi:hypothetical protein